MPVELFLSSTGRVGRIPFTIGCLLLLAAGQGFAALPHDGWHGAVAWVVYPALLFCAACLLSKRLHDVGRAGWWAFIPVFALIGAWPEPVTPWAMACAAVAAVFALWLVLAPGQKDRNRFGPGRSAAV